METIEGYIERVVFRNAENGYTVFSLSMKDSDEMTCIGNFPIISEGEYVSLEGSYTTHALYGPQFKVSAMIPSSPKSAEAMERYLASGAIKGIGVTMATRIVKLFGDKTFEIIEKEPERLSEVRGISDRIAQNIYKQFVEKQDAREAMLYLQQFGLSTNVAVKIYNTYGHRMQEVLNNNPYKLAEDIKGLGFKTADDIATRMGYNANSEYRIRAGLIYSLDKANADGHAYLPEDVLYRYATELLSVGPEQFGNIIDELCIARKLIVKIYDDEKRIYPARSYFTELSIARMLMDLNIHEMVPDNLILQKLTAVERSLEIELDEKQRDALFTAYENAIMILTGGPGTGKTTTINAIIKMFQDDGLNVLLAAPTGRAAKRMTEATGVEARTIHRLLEFQPSGGGDNMEEMSFAFQRNEENPLEADVIIIDEASMIDMNLMNALLRAVLVGTRIIFAGDARQLPSVGAGNVLSDMISSGAYATVKLTKIFRQAEESDIIMNAHRINEGKPINMDNKSKDFFMLRRDDPAKVINTILECLKPEKIPKYVKAHALDIQILTPMRKGELGVENLNIVLQNYLNPAVEGKLEKVYGDKVFREGDKVMQIKNDYQLEWKCYNKYNIAYDGGQGVFNGDTGIIKEINLFAEIVTVLFDENRQVDYAFADLDELEHAYAVTVHKSQGSEYPAVILPLYSGPKQLMNRNLLYTAVTRASKCVTIVGSERMVGQMIDNEDELKRYTGLTDAIKELAR